MDEGEDAAVAARREFLEETGFALAGSLEPLGDITQRGGKRVSAFAVEGDLDVHAIKSNTFDIEWPSAGSGAFLRGKSSSGWPGQRFHVNLAQKG